MESSQVINPSQFVWSVLRSQQVVQGWDHSVEGCKQSPPLTQRTRVTYNGPLWTLTKVTSLRTDTTLDLSQKAEKVCLTVAVTRGKHGKVTHVFG